MGNHQSNKELVRRYQAELERADTGDIVRVMRDFMDESYQWHGIHPFNNQSGIEAVVENFWKPMRQSWKLLERREDVFMAGESVTFGGDWVCSMGHFAGMFEEPWLGIPPTGRIIFFRYCEFHCIEGDRIKETYFHGDLISVMNQAGVPPLPISTGCEFIIPGPKTNDGIVLDEQDAEESAKTLDLIWGMAEDLGKYREIDLDPEILARRWHDDMMWYGPAGIGSTRGIMGFKKHHQMPFRKSLYAGRNFNGHKSRFAEGLYGGWVGWPSLCLNVGRGGYLGLPATNKDIDMRVVDIYRRKDDKIAENWVLIDHPWCLMQQDLDILDRMEWILRR